jgi:tetratricopeptide (TPR) repeat protein
LQCVIFAQRSGLIEVPVLPRCLGTGRPSGSKDMTRFACAMFVAASISCLAYADVLDLLKGGLAARSRGELDGAIDFYTQAIATGSLSDANLAIVLGSRGVTFDMKGEIDKAIDDFNEAIHLKPDYGSPCRALPRKFSQPPRAAAVISTT